MKVSSMLPVLGLLCGCATSLPHPNQPDKIASFTRIQPRPNGTSSSLGLGPGMMASNDGISFGFLPDYDGPNMASLNEQTGKKAATYGWYSQIQGRSYDDGPLTRVLSDVVSSGAVFVPAIMPTGVEFASIDANIANQIAAAVKTFTDQGVTVWLRFAHEMNHYVTDGTYPGGSPDEFIYAWRNVYQAVAANAQCLMFWSPSQDSAFNLAPWWPGADYVDIVGMDAYPPSFSTFSSVFSEFYNVFSAPSQKPFALGETGSGAGDVTSKESWLREVVNGDYGRFPNYMSATWFEYLKDGEDYRVVVGQTSHTINETMSNF